MPSSPVPVASEAQTQRSPWHGPVQSSSTPRDQSPLSAARGRLIVAI